jgi:prepilin peptidase CpaA
MICVVKMVLVGFQALFLFCVCYAVVADFRSLLIPNWVIVTLGAAFAGFALLYLEPMTVIWHVLVALAVFSVTTAFFAINWIGGGDVKLLTATALWAGPQHVASLLLIMSALGFVLAMVLMGLRTHDTFIAPCLPDNMFFSRLQALAKQGQCPYGVPIGAAALIAVGNTFVH